MTGTLTVVAKPQVPGRRPRWRSLGVVGNLSALVLLIIVASAALAPVIAPYSPLTQDLTAVLSGPSARHPLGTDALGRDLLSRILFGARVSLTNTAVAMVVYSVLGILLGLVAGSRARWWPTLVMRVADVLQSIPGTIILLVVLATFSNNGTAAMLTLGVIASASLIRVVRATALAVRESSFVAAARVAGLSTLQVQIRHVLPAVVGPALTQITLFTALALSVEAALGYLGLGTPPPTPSWGNLISDAQTALNRSGWMLIPTGGAIVLTVLALGLLGNALRDAYSIRTVRGGKGPSWQALRAAVRREGSRAATPIVDGPAVLLDVQGMSVELSGSSGTTRLVDEVSFSVAPGEAIGIVGESGCGKSITVTGILRVVPSGATVSASRMVFDGQDLMALGEKGMQGVRGSGMAYISQEPISSLDPSFTAGAQLVEAVRAHRKVGKRQARRIAMELLAQVRLPDPEEVARKYPHELSGGMCQRVAIARALAGRPKLLIADEPTTALDVTVQAEILDLLHDLRTSTGMALILVTHDWGVLADSCDRTIVMYAGQIVEEAPLRELIAHPAHPYSAALLRANPEAAETGQPLPTIPGTVPPPTAWPTGCRFASRCAFAQDACREAPIPLLVAADDHEARCIRIGVATLENA